MRKAQSEQFASAVRQIPAVLARSRHGSWGPMLSKKSPRKSCGIGIRNNRIEANGFLNQRCALAPDLESILRTRMSKIVFRQYRPQTAVGGPTIAHFIFVRCSVDHLVNEHEHLVFFGSTSCESPKQDDTLHKSRA